MQCKFCGVPLTKPSVSGFCPQCEGAPYDRPPIPEAIYSDPTGDALSKVSVIGFFVGGGETHTLVSLQDVRRALEAKK